MLEEEEPKVCCVSCKRFVPIYSLHCIYCGEAIAEIVNKDGQIALEHRGGRVIPLAVKVAEEQVQVEECAKREPKIGQPVQIDLKIKRRNRTEDKIVDVGDIILAIQRRVEVINV